MVKRLIRLALVASVLYGTGAHWAILQSVAWAQMSMSGQTDPCRVCKVVERGSTAKQAPTLLRAASALDLALPAAPRLLAVLPERTAFVYPLKSVAAQPSGPLVPPPIAVLPA